jgi:hypothetical protein
MSEMSAVIMTRRECSRGLEIPLMLVSGVNQQVLDESFPKSLGVGSSTYVMSPKKKVVSMVW